MWMLRFPDKFGLYTEEGRDSRGNIHSITYKCSNIGDNTKMRSGDDFIKIKLL